MRNLTCQSKTAAQAQRGVALIISLILLLVMSLLGVTAIRGVAMQERMAGQSYDRSLAFQAAEATLRTIETMLDSGPIPPMTGCDSVAAGAGSIKLCAAPSTSDTPRWQNSAFTAWQNTNTISTSTPDDGSISITPQYFVEYLGNNFPCDPNDPTSDLNCKRFRITARSRDNTAGRASVMLQSIYATE